MCLCSGVCACGRVGNVGASCVCACVCEQWVFVQVCVGLMCARGVRSGCVCAAKCVLRRRRVCERQVDIRVFCVRVVVCVAWLLWRPGCHGCDRWTVGRGVWPGVRGRRQVVSGCAGGVECGRQQRAAAHRLCVGVGVVVVAGCDGQVWEAVWAAGTCGRLVRCGRRVEAGLCEGVRSVKSQLCGV